MAYSKTDMQQNDIAWYIAIIEWFDNNWKLVAGFALASQFIDRFFKWLTKRSEARIKEILKDEIDESVKPELSKLSDSIDALKESIWELKNKIK